MSERYGNFDDLNHALVQCPWHVMEVYDDVNDMAQYLTTLFLDTCKQYIPNRKKSGIEDLKRIKHISCKVLIGQKELRQI